MLGAVVHLEVGAVRAVYAYNRDRFLSEIDAADPLVSDWFHKGHRDARLIDHAARKYDMGIEFRYTVRPWVTFSRGNLGSGTPGVMWSVRFVAGMRKFLIPKIWHSLGGRAREHIVHLMVHDLSHIEFKFAAVDEPTQTSDAIGEVINPVLTNILPIRDGDEYTKESVRMRSTSSSDPRILYSSVWAVDDSMNPITLFAA